MNQASDDKQTLTVVTKNLVNNHLSDTDLLDDFVGNFNINR